MRVKPACWACLDRQRLAQVMEDAPALLAEDLDGLGVVVIDRFGGADRLPTVEDFGISGFSIPKDCHALMLKGYGIG